MRLWSLLLLPLFLSAAMKNETPEQISLELQNAEAQYQRAKKMFNPWYTGPLITPSAEVMPVAVGNTQPYTFVIDNYAAYDSERKSIDLPDNLIQFQQTALVQTGITDSVDLLVNIFGQENWQGESSGGGFGDVKAVIGFLIHAQTRYIPAIKFTIQETFPTGPYQNLSSNGLALGGIGIGAGAYSTQFGLGLGKLIFWATKHPMNLRCFVGYQVSSMVDVSNFNVYGGGFGCKGRVRPGNTLTADFGYEISITERWVAAIDVVYTATNKTHFHGHPGVLADGSASAVGSPYSDNLSLAPALEYNWNSNLGIIAGAWFSVYGRSSLDFASGIISISYSFP